MNIKIALPANSADRGRHLDHVVSTHLKSIGFIIISEKDSLRQADRKTVKTVLNQALRESTATALLLESCLIDSSTTMIGIMDTRYGGTINQKLLSYCEYLILASSDNDITCQLTAFVHKKRKVVDLAGYSRQMLSTDQWHIKRIGIKDDSSEFQLPDTLSVRGLIEKEVRMFIKQNNLSLRVDELDLRYQTLFRATTYHLQRLDRQSQVKIIRTIIDEQAGIIIDRLKHCGLPLKRILSKHCVLPGNNPKIVRKPHKGMAAIDEYGNQRQIFFRQVENDIANQFHNFLHYIHTPRTREAWGFFADGDDLPFSVLGIDVVDRKYKRACLKLFGYDPDRCIEYTRLYNWPGAPRNSSSALFSQTNNMFKRTRPYLSAAISAYMPEYAKGTSMITGGFNHTIITKPLKHMFTNNKGRYEHITNRRIIESEKCAVIFNQRVLKPVRELICIFHKPTDTARLSLGREYVDISK